jgi:nucleotide-binding universal stress UspA family protein
MRIVLAIDGSPSSIQARDLVASLPWPDGTAFTLTSAYDLPAAWFAEGAMAGDWLADAEEDLRRQSQDELTSLAAPLVRAGWTVDRRVVPGRPASVILETADEVDADLIVLGSRGRGPITSMILGSVSAEVADQARASVLIARRAGVSRALVATDGSDCASVIPDVLAGWEAVRGLPAVALSVAPVDSPAFALMVSLYTLGNRPLEEQREELLERHGTHAAEIARRLSDIGIPAEAEVRSGDAAHEILAAAADRRADLIVTGSRYLHGLDRWLLGSVARNVLLHADASVLIVRPRGSPARR